MKPNLVQCISTAYNDQLADREARNYEGAREHREEAKFFYDMLVHPHNTKHANPLDLAYVAYLMLETATFTLNTCDTEEMPLTTEERELRDSLMEARYDIRKAIQAQDKDSDFWRLYIDLSGAERLA